jgi:hypothetical protein
MEKIYTLECENGKYYVGRTNNIERRVLEHFENRGSEWTKLHKPIRVISVNDGDGFDEEKYTLMAMNEYGIDNVRGGSFCRIELTQFEKDKALEIINSVFDKCYKCGEKGHFAKDCGTQIKNKKQGPNEKCSCGSDKKFKKCCGSNIKKCTNSFHKHNLCYAYALINMDKSNRLSKERYHQFADKCNGDCQHCMNTRIQYKYCDEDGDEIYCSCEQCYSGDDWGGDMFVLLT